MVTEEETRNRFFFQIETKDKIVYTQKAYISLFLNAVDNNVDLSNYSTLSPLNLQKRLRKDQIVSKENVPEDLGSPAVE